MKKIITIIAVTLLIASCSESKDKIIIKNYVQNIGGTKIDLNFKFVKIKDLPPYTNKDSIEYLDLLISQKANKLKNESKISLLKNLSKIAERKVDLKYAKNNNLKNTYKKSIEAYMNIVKLDSSIIKDVDNKNYKNLSKSITKMIKSKEILNSDLNKVLYLKKEATYKINNPLLNNAEQTMTKIFYLTPDLSKVVKVELLK